MMKKTNPSQRVLLPYLVAVPLTFLFIFIGLGFSGQAATPKPASSGNPVNTIVQQPDEMPAPLNLMEIATAMGKAKKDQGIKGEGRAVVKLLVNKRGKVTEYDWLKKINPEVDALVEEAIPKLKFSPGVKEGKKVNTWVTLPFQFTDKPAE